MKWNFLVVAVLIITMLLGCSSKPPVTLPPTQEYPTPTAPSVTPVLPPTEPPKTEPTLPLTPTVTPTPIVTFTDPVKIETGFISGALIGEPGKDVHIYRGIPYAAPPVGDLRWKPPQPAASWLGVRECTVFSRAAPQPAQGTLITSYFMTSVQDEDCLYLNVLTPAKTTSEKLPVMVWLHQGGYSLMSGNDPGINLPRLPQNGIVLVTVNMRLGALGLLANPLLSKESPNGVSGNYMFLDIIASLQWVQRNIAAFGGDPGNVTIFGLSGGGGKVANMMASPLAKGLFHRAICESGTSADIGNMFPRPLKDLEAIGQEFFKKLGVDQAANPLQAARALPWQKILEASGTDPSGGGLYKPAVDGWYLPDTVDNIFQSGKMNAVPLITLTSLGELSGKSPTGVFPFLPSAYAVMLNSLGKVGVKGYACLFDQVPSKWRQEGMAAVHSMERYYVFGDWDNKSGWTDSFYSGFSALIPSLSRDPGLNEVDRKVSEAMMAMWTQFARTGDPNVSGLVTWPAYEASTDQYLYISDPLQVKSGFSTLPK